MWRITKPQPFCLMAGKMLMMVLPSSCIWSTQSLTVKPRVTAAHCQDVGLSVRVLASSWHWQASAASVREGGGAL